MLHKLFVITFSLLKGIIARPAKNFKKIEIIEHEYYVYYIFLLSALIAFIKSFQRKGQTINFFPNDLANNIMSFLGNPQVQWFVSFLCYILLISMTSLLCSKWLKRYDKRSLKLCFLSISVIGIFLQVLFFTFSRFSTQEVVHVLRLGSFFWIITLSVAAIKNSQDASWFKSIIIYMFSAIPIVLVVGLTGIAPFLLFLD